MSELFGNLFPVRKPIIAMLHVFVSDDDDQVLRDLEILQPHVDGVIVENYGWGYEDQTRATYQAGLRIARLTERVVHASSIPVGVNILPNDFASAFVICRQRGARFIQLDHVTGRFVGLPPVTENEFRVYRRDHKAVAVLGGIHPKYYRLSPPIPLIEDSARVAIDLTDAIVVTGEKTGGEASEQDLQSVRRAIGNHPIIVGSGLNLDNLEEQLSVADGAIVGSAFKPGGVYPNSPIYPSHVREFMDKVKNFRETLTTTSES